MKNPYMVAFEEYRRCDRGVGWTDALDYHFQLGAVVSTAGLFVMARPVAMAWEDARHLALDGVDSVDGMDAWHLWCVAGDLQAMVDLARAHGVRWITYQRHGNQRLRRVELARLFNSCG